MAENKSKPAPFCKSYLRLDIDNLIALETRFIVVQFLRISSALRGLQIGALIFDISLGSSIVES